MSIYRKAERRKAKLRLAITGPAGSGKTYSALLVAFGIGGKIALLDTENGSGDLYSSLKMPLQVLLMKSQTKLIFRLMKFYKLKAWKKKKLLISYG